MFSFKKDKRLKTKKDYDDVFEQCIRIATPEFTFLYRYNKIDWARLGLIIPKKQVHQAHDRNRIKRILRESFRIQKNLPCIDLIILVRNKVDVRKKDQWMIKINKVWDTLLTLKKV